MVTKREGAASALENSGDSRILVIDDDRKLCRLIRDYLEPNGYKVKFVHTGPEGLERAQAEDFSAVILDVMLPGMDGFDVLKELRKKSDVPVLMLTSRGDEADRIVGLEIGADDYLPKTFSTRELLARLRAVTRRASARASNAAERGKIDEALEELVAGDLRVQPESRSASLGGETLTLTPVEFDILESLLRSKGRVKKRERLFEETADRDFDGLDRSIDVHVSSLRKKLRDDPKSPRFIKTIRAVGYLFIDPDRPGL